MNQYDNTPINSPFRWAGGKFYARKLISDFIPKHEQYIEPFFGGGSIFFYKNKTKSILNDADKELMNCYRIIKNRVDELIEYLDGEKATKERHNFYKNEFKPKNSLERAAQYYYLNRTSYSGIMKLQNCFFGYGDKYSMRPENWGRQLKKNSEKLIGTKLLSDKFEDLFDKVKLNKDTFLFIDPPYYNADQDKFYRKSFDLDDHRNLMKILKKYRNKVKYLITYDDCEEIRNLYSWADNIIDKEWNYTINRTDDQKNEKKLKDGYSSKRKKGKEIFIINYPVPKKSDQLKLF